ncbi:MAG TPA: hypothetical protein VKF62_14600 [Planctomycetota bacterium]|nr:hypothetical protein [Planctomycetota bacterium]
MAASRVAESGWSSPAGDLLPSYPGSGVEAGGGYSGDGSAEDFLAQAGLQKGRPVIVYVETKVVVRDEGGHTFDRSHFADERVAISSKLFGLVKVREGSPLAKSSFLAGASAPRFVVFDAKGKRVGTVDGPPSASRLYGLMKQAVAASFERPLEQFVREYRRLLDGIDAIETRKESLERQRDQLAESPNPVLRRKVETLESEIKTDSEALVAKEKDLLNIAGASKS